VHPNIISIVKPTRCTNVYILFYFGITTFFDVLLTVYLSIFISLFNQLDAQNFCFTISLFHACTCFEHMCSKHVEAWNKLIVKQKFCASSWLITEIKTIYMFQTVFPSIIRSSRPYIQQCLVWHMPVAVCTVLKSWWWMERPSETCRVSFRNKINFIHWCI